MESLTDGCVPGKEEGGDGEEEGAQAERGQERLRLHKGAQGDPGGWVGFAIFLIKLVGFGAFDSTVLRIVDVYPGSWFLFIPDPTKKEEGKQI